MNTKLVMALSAIFLAVIGIGLTFMPQEIAAFTGLGFTKIYQLQLQILGALFFAFAMLNWMAKGSIIGGIYNRPIAIANFTHFFIGGVALVKAVAGNVHLHYTVWILAILYSIFAILFGIIFSRHPSQ
jgi:hypothetical protein